jgi:hypothetical protein
LLQVRLSPVRRADGVPAAFGLAARRPAEERAGGGSPRGQVRPRDGDVSEHLPDRGASRPDREALGRGGREGLRARQDPPGHGIVALGPADPGAQRGRIPRQHTGARPARPPSP